MSPEKKLHQLVNARDINIFDPEHGLVAAQN